MSDANEARSRAFFNNEPFVGRTANSIPGIEARIANALEIIAYQLWSINQKIDRFSSTDNESNSND